MRDQLEKADSLLSQTQDLIRKSIATTGRFELLENAKEVVEIEWHDRTETPPCGLIWASDGYGLWTLRSDGKPIPETATAVKFWAVALIPKPPLIEARK
jgi:hypothetical protein